MPFCDLSAEREPDAGAFRLRREERNEEVLRFTDPRPLVFYPDEQRVILPLPTDAYAARNLERGVHRVSDEID